MAKQYLFRLPVVSVGAEHLVMGYLILPPKENS